VRAVFVNRSARNRAQRRAPRVFWMCTAASAATDFGELAGRTDCAGRAVAHPWACSSAGDLWELLQRKASASWRLGPTADSRQEQTLPWRCGHCRSVCLPLHGFCDESARWTTRIASSATNSVDYDLHP